MGNSYVEISYVKRFQFHMCKFHMWKFHMCKFHMWKGSNSICGNSICGNFQCGNFICEKFTYEIFVRDAMFSCMQHHHKDEIDNMVGVYIDIMVLGVGCKWKTKIYGGKPPRVPGLARFVEIVRLLLFLVKFHLAFIWEASHLGYPN